MTNETVEQVERVIRLEIEKLCGVGFKPGVLNAAAQAAIAETLAAIRVATPGMIEAGAKAMFGDCRPSAGWPVSISAGLSEAFTAMIDAISTGEGV